MKRKLTLLLAIALVIAFPLTAFAADSYDYNIYATGTTEVMLLHR